MSRYQRSTSLLQVDSLQGLESTLCAVWAGHDCTGGCSVCGVHTLTFNMITTETMALQLVRLYHGCPPNGVEEGIQCGHGVLIHDTGVMVRQ